MRVLVDSSVWIEFFRGAEIPSTKVLDGLISHGEDICICGHILSEVLRGCRHDAQFQKVERRFSVLQFLKMTEQTFKESAQIYRILRRNGTTLKNHVDTHIAAVAREHDVWLLYDDNDFDLITAQFPIKSLPKG